MADPILWKNAGVAFTTSTATGSFVVKAGVKSAELPISKAELDDKVMGDNLEVVYPGLVSAPITLSYRQEFTASGIDKFFWTKFNGDLAFRARIAPVNGAISTTNPGYQWSKVRVHAITPMSGAHGVLLENKVELRPQSGCTLTRDTAS